jgi:crotonobetainyl-CoA:carnitine CoA-transferase CaiB-like acyl-CoA transferase
VAAALDGVRIADFSHVIAGPYCTMILADLGADVVKIEPPRGDAARAYNSPDLGGDSTVFLSYNRNKRSVVLDLSIEEGRQVARDIVARSDILVENFASGVMQRLGLDYAATEKINPSLVYCSISAYGRSGTYASRAGYDQVVQAESGFMSLNGYPGMEPLRTPLAMIDLTTGMFAAHAILAALYARQTSGRGQYIEAALFDNAFGLTAYFTMNYLVTGENPPPPGNSSPVAAPLGVFHAADGKFFMTVASQSVWHKLLEVLGNPRELLTSDFEDNAARVRHERLLVRILEQLFGQAPLAHWIGRMREGGVPAGPIRSIAEAVNSPEVKERAVLGTVPHTRAGEVPNLRLPLELAGTPLRAGRGAPVLGEHTLAVLSELLQYDAARITGLERKGVIAASPLKIRG